jgi:acetyltransferase-like isoleucine patch superfamily enzyme
VKFIEKIFFIWQNKKNNTKISFLTYLKGIENIFIGKNTKIHAYSDLEAIRGKIEIGNNVIINRYVFLLGNKGFIKIGNGVEINNFTRLDGIGGIEIGNNVLIGPKVEIISYQHNYINKDILIKNQSSCLKKIVINDDVWIGANSVIMAGVNIGTGAVIGDGSIVTKDVEPYSVVVGNPAKKIKERNYSEKGFN